MLNVSAQLNINIEGLHVIQLEPGCNLNFFPLLQFSLKSKAGTQRRAQSSQAHGTFFPSCLFFLLVLFSLLLILSFFCFIRRPGLAVWTASERVHPDNDTKQVQ